MADIKTGNQVVAQANDNSLFNTEPVVAKAAVVGIATSILIALGAFGLVTEEQRNTIVEQVGNITVGIFIVAPFLIQIATALWQRLSAYSPRSAAKIAVDNAAAPIGTPPVLDPAP
jgi:hypothetical protein